MKPFKRVVVLAGIVAGIVLFWLMPGINKAKDTYYTRRYEDTETRDSLHDKTVKSKQQAAVKMGPEKKIYKKERIHSRARLKDIRPKMYSRAIHFEEETMLEKIAIDSIQLAQSARLDSAVRIQKVLE